MGYGFSIAGNNADTVALALSPFQSDVATSIKDETTENAGLPDSASTAFKSTIGREDQLGKAKKEDAINGHWV